MPSFATAGPVKYAWYRYSESAVDTIPGPGVDLYVRIGLRNTGGNGLIPDVSARIAAVDSLEDYASVLPVAYGTLFSVDTASYSTTPAILSIGYDRVPGDTASFVLSIYSIGVQFWRDTMKIVVPRAGAIEKGRGLPTCFGLSQNYPNPFNPSTTIRYELPKASRVNLAVYDVLGRQVSVLVNQSRNAGVHEVEFDASGLASGFYFYKLQAENFADTKKLLLIR
jgi:hypothetical protein